MFYAQSTITGNFKIDGDLLQWDVVISAAADEVMLNVLRCQLTY